MWTTPRTWAAGEVITSKMLNEHVRDNLEALRARVDDLGPVRSAAPFASNEQGPGLLLTVAAGLAAGVELKAPVSRRRLLRPWSR